MIAENLNKINRDKFKNSIIDPAALAEMERTTEQFAEAIATAVQSYLNTQVVTVPQQSSATVAVSNSPHSHSLPQLRLSAR